MITGAQCRAARALVEWSVAQLATAAAIEATHITAFEERREPLTPELRLRLQQALERGGASFIAEQGGAGAGVRLKFARAETRAVKSWEGEGGRAAEDDV